MKLEKLPPLIEGGHYIIKTKRLLKYNTRVSYTIFSGLFIKVLNGILYLLEDVLNPNATKLVVEIDLASIVMIYDYSDEKMAKHNTKIKIKKEQ